MKRIVRDGIFSFVIAGMVGAYTYFLGVNAPDRQVAEETETPSDETEELSSDTQ